MEVEKEGEVRKFILRKLFVDKRIGGRHTSIDNLKKGVPPGLRIKHYDRIIEDLIKEGYIVRKPTGYGMHVYLNSNMIPEIKRILDIQ